MYPLIWLTYQLSVLSKYTLARTIKQGASYWGIHCTITLCLMSPFAAHALEPVAVIADEQAVDITGAIDFYLHQDDSLKVSTAPDANGIVRRIEVRSRTEEEGSHWAVFALSNSSSEQIDRLIVAPHYRLVGSGLMWPDMDAIRINSITPSEGFTLERIPDTEADVFLITMNPGTVITFVAELTGQSLPKLYVWDPDSYKDTVNSYTMFHGIILGISGLMAVFLTILFVVRGSALFPAAAALAWAVLYFITVDFGFLKRVLVLEPANLPQIRATAEIFVAASLLIFVYAYLRLHRWHSHFTITAIAWMLGLVLLFGIALVQPAIGAGIARISLAATGLFGAGAITWLTYLRYDRAIMLIPTWILLLAWIIAAYLAVENIIANDVIQSALASGLVLITMLLGFSVIQHAFSGGVMAQGLVSDVERQALALAGSNGIVWDWDIARDRIYIDEEAAAILGETSKTNTLPRQEWINKLHPNDRDHINTLLDILVEHGRGRLKQAFRIRSQEGYYFWFELHVRPILDGSGNVVRCVGNLRDVTTTKHTEERLLHDAIHDNLTGLEGRQVFVSRLNTITAMAQSIHTIKPSVFYINIDEFTQINRQYGVGLGDTLLLTIARRVGRLLQPGDVMARFEGDQFAVLLLSRTSADQIASTADAIKRSLASPIQFAENEIAFSASIGIATWSGEEGDGEQLVENARLGMIQAKRFGGNRIEPYRPAFRATKDNERPLAEDLREALQNGEIEIYYQPIVRLEDRKTVGFEALARWEHPDRGTIPPSEFIPLAENSGLIARFGAYMADNAIARFAAATKDFLNPKPFLSLNISSVEILRNDFVADIVRSLKENDMDKSRLHLELTENLVMRNPEYSIEVLTRIKSMGISLSLDDFGTGYSSLAYLLKFPFDTLKIDKSFVQEADQHERSILLRSIVALGHGLEQTLIAEGIEHESDLAELLQLGCELGQGFLFGEPMAAEKLQSADQNSDSEPLVKLN